MSNLSPLQKARYAYEPKLPEVLRDDIANITAALGNPTKSVADQIQLLDLFPLTYGAPVVRFTKGTNPETGKTRKIGVILSGGQAPGGHNVIAGIFDALKKANPKSVLYGFKGGPSGIIDGDFMEITDEIMDAYRNTGGFDIIGSGRTKLETEEQFEKSLQVCKKNDIDGVVVIGGDDSNTNGAVLAEWFKKKNSGITVVGCPKTIDGDLKNELIETSFGFDTATKTFSELIGNIEKDANSAKKYWHFIKLMGRSASHIALECALQTQPNVCIISEEVKEKNMSLDDVVEGITDVIVARGAKGLNFGVALIPEGLIEFIPEVGRLISELNDLLAKEAEYFSTLKTVEDQREWINHELSRDSSYVFSSLPRSIKMQLLDDRDPHGNVQVSRIETEKLLIELVGEQLDRMKLKGEYNGKFSALAHFFGYEGRCAFPSNFDSDYCYGLGYSAFLLLSAGLTGYIANIANLHKPANQWIPGGIPLTMMMNMEQRHGERKPVIRKALVELDGAPFKAFAAQREKWAVNTDYTFPGAIQYYGPTEVCDQPSKTLKLEKGA
ncbi:MAG: diphosphate--fructose-6-phosphate 1-phosphotransferase [Spirochaetes bacterium]|nr:MAG: diphosphate--fructose-6-phosphate 1-phosphotransferase [Spirochaetota bacterium]